MKKRAKPSNRFFYLCGLICLTIILCVANISPAQETVTVTAIAGEGGTIDPAGTVTLPKGGDQLFEIYPDPGYAISAILVNGSVRPLNYPINITKFNYQVTVNFSFILEIQFVDLNQGTVIVTATAGEGGTIDPAGEIVVPKGGSKLFSIYPATGYGISAIFVNGSIQPFDYPIDTTKFSYQLVANFNSTLEIRFVKLNQETVIVTAIAGEGGTIDPSGEVTVAKGGEQLFVIYPDPGYGISAILVNGLVRPFSYPIDTTKFNYQLTVNFSFTLEIQFVKIYNVITATAGEGGSIQPSGGTVVLPNESQRFEIESAPGYFIADVKVDGVSQEGTGPWVYTYWYTFENVTSDHTIEAIFSPTNLTITATAEDGGCISPQGPANVPVGKSLVFTIAPDFCQKIKDIMVDGDSVIDSVPSPDTLVIDPVTGRGIYTFNEVLSNHTINAVFEEIDPIIITPIAGSGTWIAPNARTEIPCRGTESFQITSSQDHQYTVLNAKMSTQVGASLKWDVPEIKFRAKLEPTDRFSSDKLYLEIEPANNLPDSVLFPLELAIEPDGHWTLDSMKVDNQWITIDRPQWPGSAPDTDINITDDEITIINPLFRYGIELTFSPSIRTVKSIVKPGKDGLFHGRITPDGTNVLEDGGSMTFTIEPYSCYQVDDIQVTRFTEESETVSVMEQLVINSQTGTGTYKLDSIQSDCQVEVTFGMIYYTVRTLVEPDGGGTIQPGSDSGSEAKVSCGEDQTFEIKPADSYRIKDVLVDGQSIISSYGNWASSMYVGIDYPIYNISANHTIAADFQRYYRIAITMGNGGKMVSNTQGMDAAGDVKADEGQTAQFNIIADPGYYIKTLVVDGVPVTDLGDSSTEYIQRFPNLSEDHTLLISFTKYYTITASVGNDGIGGEISPDGATEVTEGMDLKYIFTPDDCYEVSDVVIDEVSHGSLTEYTFENVSEDSTIRVDFAKISYKIIAEAVGNGEMEPSGEIATDCGDNIKFTITPDPCYEIRDVKVHKGRVGPTSVMDSVSINPLTRVGIYRISDVRIDYKIKVTFMLVEPFTVTSEVSGEGGTISPDTRRVSCGKNTSITITPDTCYSISDVSLVRGNETPTSVMDEVVVDRTTGVGIYKLTDVKSDCSIYATFEKAGPFTVTAATASPHGIILPGGTVQIACGSSMMFSITPAECYMIADVKIQQENGESVSVIDEVNIDPTTRMGMYELHDIRSNHTIEVIFNKRDPFTITVDPDVGGKIEPIGDAEGNVSAACGLDQAFTVKPDEGYRIKDIVIDGQSVDQAYYDASDEFSYTFPNVAADHTITAAFQRYHVISVNSTNGGVIIPAASDVKVDEGETLEFLISAVSEYYIETLLVDNSPVPDLEADSTDYTLEFSDVSNDHTVDVTFGRYYTIAATSGAGGSIIPEGSITICRGSDQKYTFVPNEGYEIQDVFVNGLSSGPLPEYTFENLSADSSIHATFVEQFVIIIGDVDGDGEISSRDAMLVLLIAAAAMTPTEEQEIAADMNEDGAVTSMDAILILQAAIGLAAPTANPPDAGNNQISIILPDMHGIAGESIIVPVKVDTDGVLAGGDISIGYNGSVLRAVSVISDADVLMASNFDESGTVRISFAASKGLSGRALASIEFDILTDDISPLNLCRADLYRPDSLPLDTKKLDGRFESWSIAPERSSLLQNFPNPFNPDTWIPYQLRKDSEVTIQIFSLSGEMVRELNLGHKPAGSYVSQDRAAHWDGTNTSGERVASGIYFYNLRTGDLVSVRKMTILH